jgi:peptidoglycan/LPS O-acetylase OafA/YrhL
MRPSWGGRLPGIEGLRAIAAVSVVLVHVWISGADSPELAGAGQRVILYLSNGLTLFFVLSGFLLYRPFAAAIAGVGPYPRIGNFARNRVLRIYPALIVAFAATGFLLQVAYIPTAQGLRIGGVEDLGTALANFTLTHSLLPDYLFTGINPSRTLTAELCFYAILPVLGYLGTKGRSVWTPPLVLLAVGLAVKGYLVAIDHVRYYRVGTWGEVVEQSLLAVGDLFAYGMLAAAAVVTGKGPARRKVLAAAAGLGVLGLLTTGEIDLRLATSIWGLAAAALVLGVGMWQGEPSRLMRLLETRLFVAAGLISYSLYLWHEPLILFMDEHGLMTKGDKGFFVDALIALPVTAAVAALSFRFVEKPAMGRKKRTDARPQESVKEPSSGLTT